MTLFAGLFIFFIQSLEAPAPPVPHTQQGYYAVETDSENGFFNEAGNQCDQAQEICKIKCKDYPDIEKETCKIIKKEACDYFKEYCKHQEVPLPLYLELLLFLTLFFLFFKTYFSFRYRN
ncbi:MAG: hypothetical protein ACPGR7_05615 [Flavobacteriaceae bacterium]